MFSPRGLQLNPWGVCQASTPLTRILSFRLDVAVRMFFGHSSSDLAGISVPWSALCCP